jgi:hypothetical protein
MAFGYQSAVQHVGRYVEHAARTVAMKHAPAYGVVNVARAIATHHVGMTRAPQTYDSVRRALGK